MHSIIWNTDRCKRTLDHLDMAAELNYTTKYKQLVTAKNIKPYDLQQAA